MPLATGDAILSRPITSEDSSVEPGSDQTILFAIIGAVVGLFLGYIFGHRSAPGTEKAKELEEKLDSTLAEKRQFEERVTEHFAASADKLNRLTEQYREIHQHMMTGAEALCNDGASGAFKALDGPADTDDSPAIESDDVVVEPPRDYAPKTSPEEPGVLNERFGLENDVPAESTEEGRKEQPDSP